MPMQLPRRAQPLVVSAIGLRRAIGFCGLALPPLLGPGGYLVLGVPIQDSLSAYVHTPLRDLFVGLLFALSALFFCYRGHDRIENWTAHSAALFALGLALFPLDPGNDPLAQRTAAGLLHTVCGGGFFLTMTVYALLHFPRRRPAATEIVVQTELEKSMQWVKIRDDEINIDLDLDAERSNLSRNLIYRVCGLLILASMLVMSAYLLLPFYAPGLKVRADAVHALFWLEWLAVWSFAAAWLTKGRAIFTTLVADLLAQTQQKIKGRR